MKKALIITYYWPPAGGAGVQRIAKFCKYLGDCGWEPVVLTVRDGNFPSLDPSLEYDVGQIKKVHKVPTWEPHKIYYKLAGKQVGHVDTSEEGGRAGIFKRMMLVLAEFIRLNFFIPDSRIGWYGKAVRAGEKIIREERPAIIFSSAPPFTVHLIGLRLKKKFMLPWVTDFRDPWLENLHYNKGGRFWFVKWINSVLEKKVISHADHVVCVGEHLKQILLPKVYGRPSTDFTVITNGYDNSDVVGNVQAGKRFILSYFGTIYPQRFPVQLLSVLRELIDRDPELADNFSFRIIGNISPEVKGLVSDKLPAENLAMGAYVSHREILEMLYQPQLLLLTIDKVPLNEHIITGKIFDYLPTGNPILGVGPVTGDAAKIIRQTETGAMFDYMDIGRMKDFVYNNYFAWKDNSLNKGRKRFPAFERKKITGQLAEIFDALLIAFN